jgi:hypothetical protein
MATRQRPERRATIGFVVRSDRPLIELLRALQCHGEVIDMSSEIVELPQPVKRPPIYSRAIGTR